VGRHLAALKPIPGRLYDLLTDLDWALAHFTLVADVSVLREMCRFACAEQAVSVRYEGLLFAALAFWGEDPPVVARLVAELVEPGEAFYLVLNAHQAELAWRLFEVEHVDAEWQMCFEGDASLLDDGGAVELTPADLPAMRGLAVGAGLMALEDDPFRYGPVFGVWAMEQDEKMPLLASMAATRLQLPGASEIGNVGTRSDYRRRGLARKVVSTLVRAHVRDERQVFLMVLQMNDAAVRLYESMGFVRRRPTYLMQCKIGLTVT